MKWLHLSDMHFIANYSGGNTRLVLDCLLDYLGTKKIRADELFITGDFRFAKTQDESKNSEVAKKVSEYIWEIANCLGILDEKHIHIVPGNHDLNQKERLRKNLVDGIRLEYLKA